MHPLGNGLNGLQCFRPVEQYVKGLTTVYRMIFDEMEQYVLTFQMIFCASVLIFHGCYSLNYLLSLINNSKLT